jgi:hypothetical protein
LTYRLIFFYFFIFFLFVYNIKMNTTTSSTKHSPAEALQRAGVSAGVSAGLWAMRDPQLASTFSVRGTEYPAWQVLAVVGGVSSLVVNQVSDMLASHIPKDKRGSSGESLVLHLMASAGAYSLVPRVLSDDFSMEEMRMMAIHGAGTELITSYLADKLVKVEEALFF